MKIIIKREGAEIERKGKRKERGKKKNRKE